MSKPGKRTLSDLIGPIQVDHNAYLVRTGKLELAISFFVDQFHWIEEVWTTSDWGTMAFLRQPNTTNRIQLSEYNSRPTDLVTCRDDCHLAIAVMLVSAQDATKAIITWAIENGLDEGHYFELANETGTKVLVYLPAIFTFALEVVKVNAFRTS